MERYDIDKINALDILDVAEELGISAKKCGSRYRALCVWHNDHSPSMYFYPSTNRVHCFACSNGGTVIDLIMQKLDIGFKEACEWANPSPQPSPEGEGVNGRSYLKKQERLLARPRKTCGGRGFHHFPSDYLDGNDGMASSFARCMKQVFGGTRTAEIVRAYRLGSLDTPGRYPDVMFPSIDINGRIRDIKVQAYDCDERSDRFFHRTNTCYWLGPKVYNVDDFDRGCLFGEHLLAFHPAMTVALVESPKNACVGAAAHPEFIWVAVGNKSALNREVLSVLQGRQVVVFPDSDAHDDWKAKLDTMQDLATFVCQHIEGANGKEDIADVILSNYGKQLRK